jgi:uncharacterized protein YbaP (TraB family)
LLVIVANAWAGGDLEGLGRSLVEIDPGERVAMERSVIGRNGAMAARIEELHATGRRVFVAAGILHMVGGGGLPGLLAERGFLVERVQFDGRVGLDAMKE